MVPLNLLQGKDFEVIFEPCPVENDSYDDFLIKFRKVFLKDDVEAAFRYMAAGQHTGKIVIKIEEDHSKTHKQLAAPQYYCLENRSYIILGGLGGFGLELGMFQNIRD